MSAVYDNWERLVRATIRREELRLSALRTPSDLSLASSSRSLSASSSSNFIPSSNQGSSFNFYNLSLVGVSFSCHQILQATNDLSSSNLIKYGRSGDFFHGVLEAGNQVVVKKVDLSSAEKMSFLMSELEFFAKVSHPKFVPLLGYCFEDWNHGFLVYKYMPNKDLSTCFYMKTDSADGPSILLDWKMRLKVATEVAQALCHLHHHCVPPIVHGNVDARSILIDENYDVHLGRLIKVCTERKDRSQNRISRLLRLPKGSQRHVSAASNGTRVYDVYCFGKVLLELVTGFPVSSNHSNSVVTDWMENVLAYITTYDKELFVNVMDPFLTRDEGPLDEVWTVAVVAKACLSPKPSKRPLMTNVLKALQEYRLEEFSTYVGSQSSGQLTIVPEARLTKQKVPDGYKVAGTSPAATNGTSSDSWTTSWNNQFPLASGIDMAYQNDRPNLIVFSIAELRAATRNFSSDGFVGEGGFGRVYKGRLPEKSTSKRGRESLIAVKRWNHESLQGFEEWRNEIEMLGRLSHPNLIKLLGYCYEDKELLLVYEYMPKGYLKNHLYGRGSAVQPLSWGIRLKILIGAARGLAYLHALKREVIYRDFKTASILLDTSYNAKLTDFGFARIGPPGNETHVTTLVMGTYGSVSPEYIATGHLYVKSDVYCFGVVMLEVLTGLCTREFRRPQGQQNLIDWITPRLYDEREMRLVMDSRLGNKYPLEAAVKMAQLASACISPQPRDRPSMKEVVKELEHIELLR